MGGGGGGANPEKPLPTWIKGPHMEEKASRRQKRAEKKKKQRKKAPHMKYIFNDFPGGKGRAPTPAPLAAPIAMSGDKVQYRYINVSPYT